MSRWRVVPARQTGCGIASWLGSQLDDAGPLGFSPRTLARLSRAGPADPSFLGGFSLMVFALGTHVALSHFDLL